MTLIGYFTMLSDHISHHDSVRRRIVAAIEAHPEKITLKQISLALERNPAYLQQYLTRGSPKILPEEIRYRLAEILQLDERELRSSALAGNHKAIAFFEHSVHRGIEHQPWLMPVSTLEHFGIEDANQLKLARIGDSTLGLSLFAGDIVMLDIEDTSPKRAGYFALDIGEHIRVRYLEQNPDTKTKSLTISHCAQGGYSTLSDTARIIGRVIFHFRMLKGREV